MGSEKASILVLEPEILQAIDQYLEEFYQRSIKAGEKMAEVDLKNAQIRGLEKVITSVSRFSEIINYIKNQAGKEKKEKKWSEISTLLLEQLDLLEARAIELGENNPAKTLDIKMRLARGWAKQVVAHYLFTKS